MRHAGLAIQDTVILERKQLQHARVQNQDCYRIAVRRSKTGTGVNNPIPKDVGDELLAVLNGNPRYFFWSGNGEPVTITKHCTNI